MVLVNFILRLLISFEKETKYVGIYSVAQIKIDKTLFTLYLSITKDLRDVLNNPTGTKSNKKYDFIYTILKRFHCIASKFMK
jgi:hypothetical protein